MKRKGNGTGSVYKLQGTRSKPWAARKTTGFKENGQPIYKFIGYYRTKAEAIAALVEYNKSPYSLDGERLCDVYERFIGPYSDKRDPKTVNHFKMSWEHAKPLHNEPIATLSRRQMQLFFDDLDKTVDVKRKCKSALKMLFDYAIRYDIIQPERIAIFNYIDLTTKVPTQKVERKVYTADEMAKLWEINDNVARCLLFLIYTGLRAGEYCDLTSDSIDDNMVIHVNRSKTEAGIRNVPLSDKAQKLLPMPYFKDYKSLWHYFRLHITIWHIVWCVGTSAVYPFH